MTQLGHRFESYQGLSAELYDIWFPNEASEDLPFYRNMIYQHPGAALEVGCGTGRLLIALLAEGFEVEGVDNSSDMLAICRRKAEARGISPTLYHQPMEGLKIERRYMTIYLPSGSFMLVSDREQAMDALKRFYSHLQVGGQLLIATRLAWGDSRFIPEGDKPAQEQRVWTLRRCGTRPSDGATILVQEAVVKDFIEQLQTGWYRYDVYENGYLIESYLETLKLRWYSKHELMLMLEKIGFKDVFVYGDYSQEAMSNKHSVMIFRATK